MAFHSSPLSKWWLLRTSCSASRRTRSSWNTVRQLHANGYKLAYLHQQLDRTRRRRREGLPLDLFDAVVVSCEVGVRKPDAEMFNHVTDQLGVDPGSVVLVDDFEANVDGACCVPDGTGYSSGPITCSNDRVGGVTC